MSWRKLSLLALCGILAPEFFGAQGEEVALDEEDDDDDEEFFSDIDADARREAAEAEKYITPLSEDDFESWILSKKWVVVKFTQPWCPHCISLTKEFVATAKAMEKFNFADVDLSKYPQMMQKFGIQGFPTIKIFYKGQMMEFLGENIPREANMLVPYLSHLKTPAPRITAGSKFNEFHKTQGIRVLAVVNDTKSAESKMFTEWARRYTMQMASPAAQVTPGKTLDYINEYLVNKTELLKANLTVPSVVVFPHESELTTNHSKAIRLNGPVFKDGNTLNVWILLSLPPVLHITPYTEEAAVQRQIHFHGSNAQPLITLWIHEDYKQKYDKEKMAGASDLVAGFQDAVRKYFMNFTFAVQNIADIKEEVREEHGPKDFGLTLEEGEVAVVARGGPPYMHFRWICPNPRNETGWDREALATWFEGLTDGTSARHLSSEQVPDYSGDETIRKLVGKNINDEVTTTDKPMLIYFHAGWCAGCKQWEGTFDKIAQNASDMFSMTAAKYDIEANEQPEEFLMDRVPTLYVVHPNNKTAPVKYEKDVGFPKDMDDITEWLSEQLGMPIPAEAAGAHSEL